MGGLDFFLVLWLGVLVRYTVYIYVCVCLLKVICLVLLNVVLCC